MNLRFHSAATTELEEGGRYYSKLDPDLGLGFRAEISRLIKNIIGNPQMPRERSHRYRRVNFHRFPFYLTYVIRSETIYVMAIAHEKRHPDYWIDRLLDAQ